MKLARNGAWKFAQKLSEYEINQWPTVIAQRDAKVCQKANIVIKQGPLVTMLFGIIRLGERGNVSSRIEALEH